LPEPSPVTPVEVILGTLHNICLTSREEQCPKLRVAE
jgi:hypothetical protein